MTRVSGVPGVADMDDPNRYVEFQGRRHNCYHFAAEYVVNAVQTVTLVHGTIQGFGAPPLAHAWVRLEDTGEVFEPTSGHRMTRAEFVDYFSPVEGVTYDEDSTHRLVFGIEHWGPWSEDERARAAEVELL